MVRTIALRWRLAVLAAGALWATFSSLACEVGYWGDNPIAEGEIRRAQYPLPPLWSPDAAHIAFNADMTLHIVSADGASMLSFPSDQDPVKLTHATSVSSEGIIAYIHTQDRWNALELRTTSFDGQELGIFTKDFSYHSINPTWSPYGSKIAFFASGLLVIIDIGSVDYDYVGDVERNFITMPHRDAPISKRFFETYDPPAWSPDGKQLAFIARTQGIHTGPDIKFVYVINVDGSNPRRLRETVTQPAWSPDGERIAFMQSTEGVSSIYTISPGGTNLQEIASFSEDFQAQNRGGRILRGTSSWSADGSEIRFHQNPFVVVNADGSNLRIMDIQPGALASWSPSGDKIAVYIPDALDGVRLFTMNADGSDKRVLVERNRSNDRKAIDTPWIAAQGKPAPAGFERFVWTEVPQ